MTERDSNKGAQIQKGSLCIDQKHTRVPKAKV